MQALAFCLDVLMPPRCFLCGQLVSYKSGLCPDCYMQIKYISPKASCPLCGRPYEVTTRAVCTHCLSHKPKYTSARAVMVYDEVSKRLILPFKHADRTDMAPFLAQQLLTFGKEQIDKCDTIMAVPLHPSRLRHRKYNQALLMAQYIAKKTCKTLLPDALMRVRATKSQGHDSATQRKKNVQKAFAVKPSAHLKGRRVLLIDDVRTTGATLDACSVVLRKAGAKEVHALVLAGRYHMPQ